MGLPPNWSSNNFTAPGNPNKFNYTILNHEQLGEHLIVRIKYHTCTNYEGVKVLLYQCCTLNDLIEQKELDPHFSEDKMKHYPLARFEPTPLGWKLAQLCAVNLMGRY